MGRRGFIDYSQCRISIHPYFPERSVYVVLTILCVWQTETEVLGSFVVRSFVDLAGFQEL